MLTINTSGHDVMKHFHKPEDEKRSIVVLKDTEYKDWIYANHDQARKLLNLASPKYLVSEPAPRGKNIIFSQFREISRDG